MIYYHLFTDPNASTAKAQEYYIEKIPLPTPKTDETSASDTAPTVSTASKFVNLSTVAAVSSAITGNQVSKDSMTPTGAQSIVSSSSSTDDAPVIPTLRLASKKSVRMCESVSMLSESGQVQETTQLKTSDEHTVMKRHHDSEGSGDEVFEEETRGENAEPGASGGTVPATGGRKRPKGRKQHKVVDLTGEAGQPMLGECKQQ